MKLSVALATLGIGLGMPSPETGPGEVTGVSVLPASGRVVVVIDVRGSVTVQDFTLNSPSRVVIDVMGATLRVTQRHYDGRNRAGITNIRYSQFRPDVVRIVLELDRNPSYELEYVDEEIRISFGTDQQFAAWTTSAVPGVSQAVAASQPARQNAEPPRNNRRSTRRDPAPPVRPDLVGIQQSQVPRITATWDSARISEVVAGFAAFSGYSIVLGGGIGAEMVTAQIVDQPWDVALDVILDAHGLLATEDSANPGLLRVDSRQNMAARDTLEPLITDLIDIQFARAMSLAPSIDAITTERGIVVADTTSNSLIITDVRSRVEAAKSLVDRLDRPTQQVSIQAKIILVNRTDVEDLGVQYDLGNPDAFFNDLFQRDDPRTAEAVDTDGDGLPDALVPQETFEPGTRVVTLGGNALAALANANNNLPKSALQLIFTTAIGNFDLISFVQALQEVELGDLQAEPLVTTADNTRASILVGEAVPIRTVDISAAATGGGTPTASTTFQEVGISLQVTPHVTNSGQILLEIIAENSSLQTGQPDVGFTLRKQVANSQVLVRNGETAVIAGLTVTDITVAKSGIPYLVDLPIVGKLFGVTRRSERRQDLLILVTPHIISDPDLEAELSR